MNDWTYDLFVEDAEQYKATPRKGVYCRHDASDREQFMTWFKNCARDFEQEWLKTHEHRYDRWDGYIGDAFARELRQMCFSDIYKETYNQRPHLESWYYVHLVGFPMSEDVARTFCASPVEEAVEEAKQMRNYFESVAQEIGFKE